MARCTWPIDAAAIGDRVPLGEQLVGRLARARLDDASAAQLGRHRRGVLLELGERLAHRLGQPLVEVAGHLAELHQRALHVAERLGHLLGAAQLELLVERLLAGRVEANVRLAWCSP